MEEIARGGQGALLRAQHHELGTEAALKLSLDADEDSWQRFQQEAKALAKELHDLLGLPEHIRQEDGSRDVRFISCLFLFIIFFALCDRHFCSCN